MNQACDEMLCAPLRAETICTTCKHRMVCEKAGLYTEFLDALEKLYVEFPRDIDFIDFIPPMCKLYYDIEWPEETE